LFDSNFKKYFIRHNLEQKTAGILIPLKQRGSIEFNFMNQKAGIMMKMRMKYYFLLID